jgi:hypothetical protein
VYFQKIAGETSDVIFKTAQYIAFGLFHNSQIENVDHEKSTLTFRFKSHVDAQSREKTYSSLTMPIQEFMARMLFFCQIGMKNLYATTASMCDRPR